MVGEKNAKKPPKLVGSCKKETVGHEMEVAN